MKMLVYITLTILFILILVIVLGPRKRYNRAKFTARKMDIALTKLDSTIKAAEFVVPNLKPDNEAKIIWNNDSLKNRTPFSVVYLHGFSASHEEGAPIHTDFAKRYGCNLYLARLDDHGRDDEDSFISMTPDSYLQSAEDAIAIGKLIGDKVIVMSCSTGGTLSIILAAGGEDINSLILYSPNIDIYDPTSELLLYPWGEQIANYVMKGNHNHIQYNDTARQYWNSVYHTNALFVLKSMIEDYMTEETFAKISVPVFMGYYYQDEENQDKVVSVPRMLDFYNQISTPQNQKTKHAFSKAGHHVISSYITSQDVDGVKKETFDWAEKTLGLKPIDTLR